MRKTLQRRLCGKLEMAYQATQEDVIFFIGAGSDYYEVNSREELEVIHKTNELNGSPIIDSLKFAAQMGCTWALDELERSNTDWISFSKGHE